MKKNTKKIATLLLVAVVAVGTYFVSGTYAKYTSDQTGTSTTRVAKWDVKLNGTQMSTSNIFDFDLFNTLKEADLSANETHVEAANGTDLVIAPGTGGSFDIVLLNQSEVDAQYDIDFTVTNTASIPVEFSTDGGTTWSSNLADIPASNSTLLAKNSVATIPATQEDPEVPGDETTITVQWRWAYQVQNANSDPATYTTRDTADTTLGAAGTATLSVQAKVTATQVD